MVGGLIQALVALNNESYVPQPWHQTLFTIAVISSSIFFNTVLAVRLPLIEGKVDQADARFGYKAYHLSWTGIILILHICGVFAIIVPLWVLAPRAPADVALLDYTNIGGWSGHPFHFAFSCPDLSQGYPGPRHSHWNGNSIERAHWLRL